MEGEGTNFFLLILAVVTLIAGLGWGFWQLKRVERAKHRHGDTVPDGGPTSRDWEGGGTRR